MTVLRSLSPFRPWLPVVALGWLLLAPPASAADDPAGGFGSLNTSGGASRALNPSTASPDSRARGDGAQTQIFGTQRTLDGQGNPNPAGARNDGGTDPLGRRLDTLPKPSEFQRFVLAATGRLLPVFGASFFAAPPEGLSSIDNVPVSADYTVGPGDEIVVRAWGSIDIDFRSVVDRNGQLNLPKIGSFTVVGVRASELEKHLRAQIGRLYTNFNLNVTLGQLHGVKVFVVGPAQRPGTFTLGSQSTILSAVAAAGGPGPNGSMRKVSLRRDGRIVSELDVYAFLVQGDKSKDLQLVAGDVVIFHPVGPRVALNGELDNAAIFELKGADEPVSALLLYAGGAPVLANPNRALVERIDPTQPRSARFVEEFKLDTAGLQKKLRDGDVVTLLAISPAFANAVTLTGHVAQPLRYAYFPGMRVSDLIPSAEALISPDFYRRKNVLVQMLPPEPAPERPGDRLDGAGTPSDRDRAANQARGITGAGSQAGSTGSGSLTGANNANPANAQNPSNNPNGPRPNQGRSIENIDLATEANRVRTPPTTLFDDLNWEYAAIERLNPKDLTTQVIPFNLGKLVLQGDPANNIELLPGDVVTVFSQKDFRVPVARQNRLVALEGEILTPGVYQLLPGETMRQLIARAGGFTPQAYVFGIEFSREETRQRQRENIAAAITRLETLSATQSARDAANRTDISTASVASLSSTATQAQMSRLAKVQPNGRIALELSPDANSIDSLPDFPLENSDRIIVPPRPGFVTVVGAVVNNNAFLWRPGRTAGDYLKIAGADESADTSNMFILRADGTVSGGSDNRGWFSRNSVEAQPMQPGDALIVPNQLDFETWGRAFVRNAKDWTQILANLGLGVAAINSITK